MTVKELIEKLQQFDQDKEVNVMSIGDDMRYVDGPANNVWVTDNISPVRISTFDPITEGII